MEFSRDSIYSYLKGKSTVRPLVLQWHITDRCNFRCKHCYQDKYFGEELSFKDLLKIVDQYKDLLDRVKKATSPFPVKAQINITGGEPFVRKDIMDLLEVLSENKELFDFGILCNGSFIDEKMANALRNLGVVNVQLSIEGERETNDKIRAPGSFDTAVSAVKTIKKVGGIYTAISFTASKANFREFSKVARLGCEIGADIVWSDRLVPQGSGEKMDCLSPKETREYVGILSKAKEDARKGGYKTRIKTQRALQFLGLTEEEMKQNKPYHCGAGDRVFIILPNGDLYPCRRMPVAVGNVMKTPLAELFYSAELFVKLRDLNRISEGCEDCKYLHHCRGGLKCYSYAVTGDPFIADPGCWLAKRA